MTGRRRNFSLVKKIVSVFPPFRKASQANDESSTQLSLFPLSRGFSLRLFKSYRYSFIGRIHRRPRKRKQSSTECRFAEWSTTIPFALFVRIFMNMTWRRYLRLLLFMLINSAFISTTFINRQPWQFQKLRRAFSKEV